MGFCRRVCCRGWLSHVGYLRAPRGAHADPSQTVLSILQLLLFFGLGGERLSGMEGLPTLTGRAWSSDRAYMNPHTRVPHTRSTHPVHRAPHLRGTTARTCRVRGASTDCRVGRGVPRVCTPRGRGRCTPGPPPPWCAPPGCTPLPPPQCCTRRLPGLARLSCRTTVPHKGVHTVVGVGSHRGYTLGGGAYTQGVHPRGWGLHTGRYQVASRPP